MTRSELHRALDYVDHSREKRKTMTLTVLETPEMVPLLLEIAIKDEGIIASRACWVLEYTATMQLRSLFPHLDYFTAHFENIKQDASVRPISKICEHLITGNFSKEAHPVQEVLKEIHLDRITTACFDWLIGDQKVAPKAYSMTCLFHLGEKYAWIHPELKMILERHYLEGSAAYKARARMTLAKLDKIE